MKALFTALLVCVVLNGCNLSPGAMLGDVNDDGWDPFGSSSWGSNYTSDYFRKTRTACYKRNIIRTDVQYTPGCEGPDSPGQTLVDVKEKGDFLVLYLRRSSATNVEWSNVRLTVASGYATASYTTIYCNTLPDETTDSEQVVACKKPAPSTNYTKYKFKSLYLSNKLCTGSATYRLDPDDCDDTIGYDASYGNSGSRFPEFYK